MTRARATDDDATPLPAAAVAAAKRARHRVLVKRAYHRKLNTLQILRQHEQQLTAQYNALLAAAAAQTQLRVARGDVAPTATAAIRELYVQLATIRTQLEREHRVLQQHARAHEQLRCELTAALSTKDYAPLSTNGRSIQPSGPYMTIRPLDAQQCRDVVESALMRVAAFEQRAAALAVGPAVFGWTHRYCYPPDGNGAVLNYAISKMFHGVSSAGLASRSYAIMTTPQTYSALHSTNLAATLHVIQRVDDVNTVLCRVLQRQHTPTRFKTLLLASNVVRQHGSVTVYCALDHIAHVVQQHNADSDESEDASVVWLDMCAWTSFEDVGDDAVRFEFGGTMAHTTRANAQFWMLEVLLMALRWEAMAVGPRFTLTSGAVDTE